MQEVNRVVRAGLGWMAKLLLCAGLLGVAASGAAAKIGNAGTTRT